MRRYQLQSRSQPRRDDTVRDLPLDPRDPAVLRAKQLLCGARPRLEPERHKHTHLALLEVMADTVSWSVEDPKVATKAAAATP